MGRKGRKSARDVPEDWDEKKSEKLSLQMTPTGKRLLGELAKEFGVSISELAERLARKLLRIVPSTEEPVLPTLANLVGAKNLSQLSKQAGISLERLEALARGEEPSFPELSSLEPHLDKPLEALMAIYQRDFAKTKQRKRGTNKPNEDRI